MTAAELPPHVAMFVLGEPGVGKTTAVRALLGGVGTVALHANPKWTIAAPAMCAAGHYSGEAFDGGDTVPYNGAKAALEFWREKLRPIVPLTIFDGDRFSVDSTLKFLSECPGVVVRGVYLDDAADAIARRRLKRARETGKSQNEAWVKGRGTKAMRFAAKISAHKLAANRRNPTEVMAELGAYVVATVKEAMR
jgi:hypothetical protein